MEAGHWVEEEQMSLGVEEERGHQEVEEVRETLEVEEGWHPRSRPAPSSEGI